METAQAAILICKVYRDIGGDPTRIVDVHRQRLVYSVLRDDGESAGVPVKYIDVRDESGIEELLKPLL